MGRLIQMVEAKKHKIVNSLIAENIYQLDDRSFLLKLPLKNLERLLVQDCKRTNNY